MLRRTAAPLAAILLLCGCSGSDDPGPDEPTTQATAAPTEASAAPAVPHFTGSLAVTAQPALPAQTGSACAPDAQTVCSPDGAESYRVLGDASPVTVVEAGTALDEGHTSWETTVRVGEPAALRTARQAAARIGGVVVLVDAAGAALVVAPVPDIANGVITLTDLDKPDAWGAVQRFG